MADSKISALPFSTTPLAGTEVLPVVQSGATKQVSVANLTAGRAVSAASLALTTTPLHVSSGGIGLNSLTSGGLMYAASSSTVNTSGNLTTNGTGVYSNSNGSLTGSYFQGRFNASNVPMSIGMGNLNGFPFLGMNVNSAAGSDNGTFDISAPAGRMRLDYGIWQIQQSSVSGTAGDPITWVTAVQTDTDLAFKPGADNTQTLGTDALRWSTVYAGTGTINTSDARYKDQIDSLDDVEHRVALKIKGLIRKFKFKDAILEKGDNARIHVGVVAQEIQQAFESEGLDPNRYALFCYDEWEDEFESVREEVVKERTVQREITTIDDNGNDVTVVEDVVETYSELIDIGEKRQVGFAGNRLGIRYDQLLAFVVAAL